MTVIWDDGTLKAATDHGDADRSHQNTDHRRFRFPKETADQVISARSNNRVLGVTLPLAEAAAVFGTEIPIQH